MSWELVERLRQRFPEVEPFPREGAPAEATPPAETAPVAPAPAEAAPGVPAAAPTRLPAKRVEAKAHVYLTPGAWIPAARLTGICRFVAADPAFALDYLSFVTGVDYPEQKRIEVVYHLFSSQHRHELLLKVRVPRDDPRVESVTSIWRGADWHEREAYDLLGIVFAGHPNLRRIMMTDDWVGHPLRKDYIYEDPEWLKGLAEQRQREIQGLGLGERT